MVRLCAGAEQNHVVFQISSYEASTNSSFCLREKETAAGVCKRMDDSTQLREEEQEGEAEANKAALKAIFQEFLSESQDFQAVLSAQGKGKGGRGKKRPPPPADEASSDAEPTPPRQPRAASGPADAGGSGSGAANRRTGKEGRGTQTS